MVEGTEEVVAEVAVEAATTVGSLGILRGTALRMRVDLIAHAGWGLAFVFCGSFAFFFGFSYSEDYALEIGLARVWLLCVFIYIFLH